MEPITVEVNGTKVTITLDEPPQKSRWHEPTFMDTIAELFYWEMGFDCWRLRKEFAGSAVIRIPGQKMVGIQNRAHDRHYTGATFPNE